MTTNSVTSQTNSLTSSRPPFTLALLQLNTQSDYEANLIPTLSLIRQAHSKGAQLIITPENTSRIGSGAPDDTLEVQQFTEQQHPSIKAYQAIATELKVWLCIGSVHVKADEYSADPSSDKLDNRMLFISPAGEIIARYNKIHMFDVPQLNQHTKETYLESKRFAAGHQAVVVKNTPFGNIGLSICYDVRFPHLFRQMAYAGAHHLIVAAAFTVETGKLHWHVLNRARAIENGCYVFAAAQGGIHTKGRKTYGHSLIIDPLGKILAEKDDDQPGILMASIEPAQVEAARIKIPSLSNTRDFKLTVVDANASTQNSL